MKTVVQVTEVENEGLISLLNKQVLIFCINYIYFGKLVGVNDTCLKLEKAYQVMETGDHKASKFADAQSIGEFWYIQLSAIETFGETSKTA